MRNDQIASSGSLHGWGCTPTGDPPSAALTSEVQRKSRCSPTLLRKGWRRTALYIIIVLLMMVVFLNVALTLWIISALKLTMDGIGPIKIAKGGIQLEGQAWVTDSLVTSTIASRFAQPITMQSYRNFTVLVSEPDRVEYAKLLLKRDAIECSGQSFEVRDARGNNVFHASREEVRVFADALSVTGDGGITARGSIQTPTVGAPPGSDLKLESLTRRLDLRAPQSIYLESRAGGIDIAAHSNINLESAVGAIKMDASNIIINNLKQAEVVDKPQKPVRNMKVYQLCVCSTGKLFLAAPEGLCSARDDTDLCR